MTENEIIELADVLKHNRFYFRAPGIHALADWLESTYEAFDRDKFIGRIQGERRKVAKGPITNK